SMISESIVMRNGASSGKDEASATCNEVAVAVMPAARVDWALFAAFSLGATSVHLVPVGVPSLWAVRPRCGRQAGGSPGCRGAVDGYPDRSRFGYRRPRRSDAGDEPPAE